MQSPRPSIPSFVKPDDPIRAGLINELIGLAGYFQDQPIDAIIPGTPIYIGRPTIMQVASITVNGASHQIGWDNGGGTVYGLKNGIVLTGGGSGASPSGVYSSNPLNSEQWPGVSLTEINGGPSPIIGDYVLAIPIQTPTGPLFVFELVQSKRILLTGFTLVSGSVNRWNYNWKLVSWDEPTGTWLPTNSTTPITDATDGYLPAQNSMETNNPTGAISSGTGTLPMGAPLPMATGTLQPFGTVSPQQACVECLFYSTATGLRPIFSEVNTISC